MTDQLTIPEWNTRAAVAFLKQRPGYPVLSCVLVDKTTGKKGAFTTKSFPPIDGVIPWDSVYEWIEGRQGNGNLYYSVNTTRHPVDKKLERTDLAALVSLHVDLDPRMGEDQDEAQARIIKQLDALKKPPTWIISSGGGVNAIWDLIEPVPIDGNLDVAEDLKMYNVQIERELGGDHCHNVDRILRLPGSVNCPDERKRSKGRRYATAKIIRRRETAYTIADFVKAVPVQDKITGGGAGSGGTDIKVSVPTNIAFIDNLDDDDHCKKLPPWCKHTIVFGYDLEGGKVWPSRSERAFAVTCQLVRSEVPDDKIVALMLDPDYKWNDVIREKKNVDREVKRLLSRAKERSIDEDLFNMNSRFAVVMIGGKVRVMHWRPGPHGDLEPVYTGVDDFKTFQSKYRKEVIFKDEAGDMKTKVIPRGEWWMHHPNRRQFMDVVYRPDIDSEVIGEGEDQTLNLWRGFAVAAIPGAKHESFLAHIRDNICGGNEDYFRYFVGWMADRVQNRHKPAGVAIVMKSEQEGTGKSFVADHFGHIFGKHYKSIINTKHLTGQFNDHLRDCSLLFSDEAIYAKDKASANILKGLITSPTLMFERKGLDIMQARNVLGLMLASNHDFVIPAGLNARRFFVLQVLAARLQDTAYFGGIVADLESGGYEALLHYLATYDLKDFDIRKVPQTDALDEQKAFTREGIDALVEQIAHDGVLPCMHHLYNDVAMTDGEKRGEGFWGWAKDQVRDLTFMHPKSMAMLLERNWGVKRFKSHGSVGLKFPPLADLRKAFDKRHGAQSWDSQGSWDRRSIGQTMPVQDDIPF